MSSTNLHVYYLQRNLTAFKRYLDGTEQFESSGGGGGGGGGGGSGNKGQSSTSGPRSWSLNHLAGSPKKPDPNVRDPSGRTVLHLVCSTADDTRSYDYLSTLLHHPLININLPDYESGWTPLHRALWVGNLRAARELMARGDVDMGVKDFEGFTAFDVFNSTCEGTNPVDGAAGTDLYTWGSNRNYTLGAGDTTDRALPERVNLLNQVQARSSDHTKAPSSLLNRDSEADEDDEEEDDLAVGPSGSAESTKFDRVKVNDVAMAKFHTGVLSAERKGNLSLTGFGSNGRLGKMTHSQYTLLPQPDLANLNVVSIALGQDHSLAVTSGGYIMSWGQNRFSQLGYVIEAVADTVHKAFNSSSEDVQVQVQPKRILGPLKKEFVVGVAASRLSSACWTQDSIWTWGTNSGHLGYDKGTNPVQALPRKVTGISQSVIDMAMTDYATACLIETKEVLVLHHDAVMKISFPTQRFPSDFSVYRPPQFVSKPNIDKITSSGNTVAAVSSLGDVFTFTLPNPVDIPDLKTYTVKPQMAWALRKRFTAVKDVAIGSDSTIILCTHSGHVYVRQRQGKQIKVNRLPRLQRIIKVACNEVGSFAAIRSDATPGEVRVSGATLNDDLLNLLPHMRRVIESPFGKVEKVYRHEADEDDDGDIAVMQDIEVAMRIAIIDAQWQSSHEIATLGTDIWLCAGDRRVPVHKLILCRRVAKLGPILRKQMVPTPLQNSLRFETAESGETELHFGDMHFVTLLLLLQYIYSDDIAAIWDSRVLSRVHAQMPQFKPDIALVKKQLLKWAELLGMEKLRGPLASTGKVAVSPSLGNTWKAFHKDSQDEGTKAAAECDTVLRLSDRDVLVSSLLLRARSPTFDAMYDDKVWTEGRQNEDGRGHVVVDMTHLRFRSFSLVMRYLHEGNEQLIDYGHQETLDGLLDFVFETLAVANFLLLDRLVLVLSLVIRRHVATNNAASLATEAAFHNAVDLKRSIFSYIACNLETMLENGFLDDMDTRILSDLAGYIQDLQGSKLPVSRSGILADMAVQREAEWLADQDIPQIKARPPRVWKPRSPKIFATPPVRTKKSKGKGKQSLFDLPTESRDIEDMFDMEDDVTLPESAIAPTRGGTPSKQFQANASETPKGLPWKSSAVEGSKKVDLRSIMAEAETRSPQLGPSTPPTGIPGKYLPPSARRVPSVIGSSTSSAPGISPVQSSTPATARTERTGSWRANIPSNGTPGASPAFPTLGSTPLRPGAVKTPSQSGALKSDVIVPTRQPTVSRKSSEPAWITPVTYFSPAPPTLATSPGPSAALSLLEIQQHEREVQAHRNELKMAPKSLLEIQEQERKDEKAKVAELEFQRWWAQEEARVAAEAARLSGSHGKRKTGGSTLGSVSTTDAGTSQNAGRGKGKKKNNPGPVEGGGVKKDQTGVKKEQTGVKKEQITAEKPSGSAHETPKPRSSKPPKAPKPPQAAVAKKAAPTTFVASNKVGLAPTSSSVSSPAPKPASPLPGNLNPFAKPFGFVPGPPAGALADRRS